VAESSYTISVSRQRNFLVLNVRGELTASGSSSFYRQIQDERPVQSNGVVIDLSGVTYVDSAGLGSCVRLLLEMGRVEKRGALVIKSDGTMDSVVALANLHRVAPIFKSQEEALRCLSSPPAATQKPEQVPVG
jgi:anti-anti-sigma factor